MTACRGRCALARSGRVSVIISPPYPYNINFIILSGTSFNVNLSVGGSFNHEHASAYANTEYIVITSLCTKLLVNAKPQVRPSLIRRTRKPHHHAGAMMGVPWPSVSPRCRWLLSMRCIVPGALRHGDTPDLGVL